MTYSPVRPRHQPFRPCSGDSEVGEPGNRVDQGSYTAYASSTTIAVHPLGRWMPQTSSRNVMSLTDPVTALQNTFATVSSADRSTRLDSSLH